MAWLFLLVAGLLEMFGVAMINKLNKDRSWQAFSLLLLGFGGSFAFLALAMESLPMGTAYAVWKRIVFITMILGAAIGLKAIA
jgi:paired small multidrug resistance pump